MTGRDGLVLAAFAAVALAVSAAAPSLAGLALEVAVLALIGLSLDVVLRRLGAVALFHGGAFALAAWLTAWLLARNQSPVVALAAGALAGGATGLAVLAGHRAGRSGLAAAGLGVALAVTALAPPAQLFTPPVFLGVGLGTPRAALVIALAALGAGWWLWRALLEGDLARWVALAREAPDLLPRAGVPAAGVRGSVLALSGVLAGMAGWAAAIGTLGAPAGRAVDPAIGLAWLAIPLAGGPGVTGALAGAAVFAGLARAAAAVGVPALALAAPLAAVLLWREVSR